MAGLGGWGEAGSWANKTREGSEKHQAEGERKSEGLKQKGFLRATKQGLRATKGRIHKTHGFAR